MTKTEIRVLIKDSCRQQKELLAPKSSQICDNIINSPPYKQADEIFSYMALPDEVDLTKVMLQAIKDGKKVAVPKITSQEQNLMKFFYLDAQKAIAEQTSNGAYGISEPDEAMPATPDETKNILILVPGRAFTKEGDRLGRGKGFYDRFLNKEIVGSSPTMTRLPNVSVAGVCFDFQILESLPTDENDICMDIVFC